MVISVGEASWALLSACMQPEQRSTATNGAKIKRLARPGGLSVKQSGAISAEIFIPTSHSERNGSDVGYQRTTSPWRAGLLLPKVYAFYGRLRYERFRIYGP